MTGRRGAALVLALMALAVVTAITAVALRAVTDRIRLIGDSHWQEEAALRANTALARVRIDGAAELAALSDGDSLAWPLAHDADRWQWSAFAARHGSLISVLVTVARTGSDGLPVASRSRSLLLFRVSADTVRVLTHRPRF